MEDHREVLVLSAVRTAIGKYGGGLAAVPPCDLAATMVREAVGRAGVEPSDVGHAVFGNVIHTEARDMYLGRVAADIPAADVTTGQIVELITSGRSGEHGLASSRGRCRWSPRGLPPNTTSASRNCLRRTCCAS